MDLREALRQAFESLGEHPRRVVASAMGVFWGAAAIVFLMSFGTGMGEYARQEWGRFAENVIMVQGALSGAGHPGYRKGVWVKISREDAAHLEEVLSRLVQAVLPEHSSQDRVLVEAGGRVKRLDLAASDARYGRYRNFDIGWGRFLERDDLDLRRAVAVLGYDAATLLFGAPRAAVGRTLRISGQPFEVVGVARRKGRQYKNTHRPDDRLLIVPITSAEARLGYDPEAVSRVLIFPRPGVTGAEVLPAVRRVLGPRAGFHPDDEDALTSFDSSVFGRMFKLFTLGFTLFVGAAGTVTLLIGGVGIANYHLATLAERTVEVAVSKALGAKNRTLVGQAILESAVVSLSASLLGVALGLFACQAIGWVASPDEFPIPRSSPLVSFVAFAAVLGVAMVAATLPAVRVRRIEIAAALRAQG